MTEFSLQDFSLFVRLAESLSVAAVARERDEHPSQVSRALSRMEAECGLRLFHRSTHGLSLTDDGHLFLEHAKLISGNAARLADDLASRGDKVLGSVRISVPCILAEYVLIPNLRRLIERHADLGVSLHIADRPVDMSTEGIDIAIRAGILPRDTHVALKLGSHRRALYASPDYLAARGMPGSPGDLARHDLIANAAVTSHNQWPFDGDDAFATFPVAGRVLADNTSAIVSLAQAGLGIGRINKIIGDELVLQRKLTQVLADYEDTTEFDISAVTLAPRNRVPKIRVCLTFLSECFAGFR
ncbi:LysR family transcriptional regulator [Paraburkholderia sp. BL21I4N1]|uniref:LysR family transcriptional regulator n=1 Tax=Paraburkholderia sp. BL21I4N1 TaxID=1938801 RepID=UPI000CFD29C7|nr:LysR family transcriptional regulator [Paraburkholderia sp. BL21I4N1]PQV53098.1 DNA-binding transcriptional LysR family regulator [Paraburkholderia sp. BL21I4N1]